jgi:hypothetical protein
LVQTTPSSNPGPQACSEAVLLVATLGLYSDKITSSSRSSSRLNRAVPDCSINQPTPVVDSSAAKTNSSKSPVVSSGALPALLAVRSVVASVLVNLNSPPVVGF